MWDHKQQAREQTERLRGWILAFLVKAKPKPLEFPSLFRLLDKVNHPVSRRRLAQEIDYLRSLNLLRVFPCDETAELTEMQQTRLIQRYTDTDTIAKVGEEVGTEVVEDVEKESIGLWEKVKNWWNE